MKPIENALNRIMETVGANLTDEDIALKIDDYLGERVFPGWIVLMHRSVKRKIE